MVGLSREISIIAVRSICSFLLYYEMTIVAPELHQMNGGGRYGIEFHEAARLLNVEHIAKLLAKHEFRPHSSSDRRCYTSVSQKLSIARL